MDQTPQWEEGLFYALSVAYASIAFFALVQLVRIQLRVPEFRWTTQKVFLLMNFLVNGLRAFVSGLYQKVFLIKPQILQMVLLDVPGLLFFSTYMLLVLFWAEIYHQAKSLPTGMLRPTYMIINGIVYILQICFWVFMRMRDDSFDAKISQLFFSVVSLISAIGFLTYGGSLFCMLKHFPIQSPGRQKKLKEVTFITGICSSCFLIRSTLVTLSALDKDIRIDTLSQPMLNFIYYTLVEILPSTLVLFILRKLPPRRVSDQYHTIC